MSVAVSRPVGLLRRPVSGEGPDADGGSHPRPAQVLAQDVFAKGGHVPRRNRRDPRRHGARSVRQNSGTAFQADITLRFQSSFSGSSNHLHNSFLSIIAKTKTNQLFTAG